MARGGVEEPLGADGEVEELGAEGDVPVGIVFEDESRREAVVDDAVGGVRFEDT